MSNLRFAIGPIVVFVAALGCSEQSTLTKLSESENVSVAVAKTNQPLAVTTASVRLNDRNSPAVRRANLQQSLLVLRNNRGNSTLVQTGDPAPVPIPVLPQTPGAVPIQQQAPIQQQTPMQQQVPIELIPTPEGMPEGKEKTPGKPVKPGEPDERMAKTPEKSPANPVTKPNSEPVAPTKNPSQEPVTFTNWQKPDVTLFITGQQNGYIEPCGCTGLTKQKGGVARRLTFIDQLREKGWDLLPIDAGNQVRRIGQQATIKYGWSTEALKSMNYNVVGFGPADLRLNSIDLLQVCAAEDPATALYISGNVVLFGDKSYVPPVKITDNNGIKVAVTTILDPKKIDFPLTEDVVVKPTVESTQAALNEMAGADFKVVCFFGEEDAAKKLMQTVAGYDLIIAAGGYGEPHYEPQIIEGSKTKLIDTGYKGMYAGWVGLYKDSAFSYCRVPLTHEFTDAPKMRKLMSDYQEQLKSIGLEGLGLEPSPHASGERYVGTAACGKCHTSAMAVWEGSGHAGATDSIVDPPEDRGDVPRHFDPECLSCHVTGWNPEKYLPYESGYENLQASQHLLGNGCENCHGPGEGHALAEADGSGVGEADKLKLRKSMQLPLSRAKEHCMKCHDLDNSPDFHDPDAFEDLFWPEVEHEGKD